jgi:hypothetical protein
MDPYLEDAAVFPGLHDSFTTYVREALQPGLPEPYYADIRQRIRIEVAERIIEPDAFAARSTSSPAPESPYRGGVAIAVRPLADPPQARPVVVHVPHDEWRELFVAVYVRGGIRPAAGHHHRGAKPEQQDPR